MQTNIRDEIQGMKRIQLKQEDFIGTEFFSNVYRYTIHNVALVVKCFQDQAKAEEENAILQKIQGLAPNCPSIMQYYDIKQLDIEIIGAFNENYNGYAIFFQQYQLDLKKMLGIITKLQTKEIFNLLSQNINLQALIIQLISAFNLLKPNVNSYFPSFKSDILNNAFYPMMILALFKEQNIQLSRIHNQFNIQSGKFDAEAFHKDCDNKGSTLVIMHSSKEPNSFFGGMAAPSWNADREDIADPAGECSWLFKIEVEENMLSLHQWKCLDKDDALYGSPDCGPYFGAVKIGGKIGGAFFAHQGKGRSILTSNNEYYEKVNLDKNDKTMGLLFQLRNKINCPQKVQRAIMNQKLAKFDLDSCEVFAIKK